MEEHEKDPIRAAEAQAREDIIVAAERAAEAFTKGDLPGLKFWNAQSKTATERFNLAREALTDQILNADDVRKALALLSTANAELAAEAQRIKEETERLTAFATASVKVAKILAALLTL